MSHWRTTSSESAGFEEIHRRFCGMLDAGRHTFDAAANSLLGGTNPEVIRKDLFATDQRINEAEQKIRRLIVVHGTVHGARSFPSLLVMMSVAKDAERIGDYAKNIFDLAVAKPDLLTDDIREELIQLKDAISALLGLARTLFESQDADGALAYLADCDKIEDQCDALQRRALEMTGANGAGPALTARFFKRVVSHAANVVSSLVMPLDKLDFFDEPDRPKRP